VFRRQALLLLGSMLGWGLASAAHAGAYEDFFRAVEVDNASAVQALLAKGFDGNAPDEKGQQALFLALRGESFKVAAVLLAHPSVKVDVLNSAGESPLMMAALRGQVQWAQQLLERGAAVHKTGWSPIHYAATGPSSAVVALLLDRGAPLEAESPNRTTPLMMAAQYGSEASVDLLLARGANLRARNDLGVGVVDFAKLGGREALMARLERLIR
jgi:uncharacterized protein